MTDEEVYVDDCSHIRQPKLSFDLLAVEISSDDLNLSNSSITDEVRVELDGPPITKKRRSRGSKKKRKKHKNKKKKNQGSTSDEFKLPTIMELGGEKIENLEKRSVLKTVFGSDGGLVEQELMGEVQGSCVLSVELRQRNVTGGRGWEEVLVEESSSRNSSVRQSSTGLWMPVQNGNREKLEKELSLDWSKVMEERRDVFGGVSSTERSPFSYFVGQIYGGNTLRSTISVGNEKKRQRAITLSTCIIARNNALTALLISNNFAEIKSNVFKKVSKDNLHSVVYFDIIERFHICAFLIFVLAQNILEAEGSWFESFLYNAFLVYICEVFIDTIKHAFLAKFNEIKPDAYSDFLEDLCKQVLNTQLDEDRRNLNFIPLAPACMIIRVLTPIYATLLPYGPLPWRSFWIIVWSSLTFLILAICKILVGLSLNRLATWYINQRLASKQHVD